ncbi:hypothetical protein JW921_06780 [Candidatus Fermentibacterales bacterium]|nr:hypothetical protein [Candidatus Fermentibacterales bacterium]
MRLLLPYAAGWLGMAVLAVLNGVVREKTYGRRMGELRAHQLSTLIIIALFAAYVWGLTGMFPLGTSGQAMLVGGIWVLMTVLFELLFGHCVVGHPWKRLLMDYNLLRGRLWSLVLAWTALAPLVCFLVRA